MIKKILSIGLSVLVLISCSPEKPVGLIAKKAMVVSAREEASKIGAAILQKGGNAFDAMVATQIALAVVYPVAGNIGGGGFMVYRTHEGNTGALDFREKAPLKLNKRHVLRRAGQCD